MLSVLNFLVGKFLYDGPAMVSTGQRVGIMALGKVEAVGLGEPGRRQQKT
jgi:hypothetical protein